MYNQAGKRLSRVSNGFCGMGIKPLSLFGPCDRPPKVLSLQGLRGFVLFQETKKQQKTEQFPTCPMPQLLDSPSFLETVSSRKIGWYLIYSTVALQCLEHELRKGS